MRPFFIEIDDMAERRGESDAALKSPVSTNITAYEWQYYFGYIRIIFKNHLFNQGIVCWEFYLYYILVGKSQRDLEILTLQKS